MSSGGAEKPEKFSERATAELRRDGRRAGGDVRGAVAWLGERGAYSGARVATAGVA